MSLNTITLSPAQVAAFYSNSLVEIPSAATIEKSFTIASLGKNENQILILVDNNEVAFLLEKESVFLTNILAACKLTLDQVAVVNRNQTGHLPYNNILGYFKSKVVLLFGVDPISFGLPVNFPLFQIQTFDAQTFLYAPPLAQIEADKLLKTQLWQKLKLLFGL